MTTRCDRSFFISLLSGLTFFAAASLLGGSLLLADETVVLTVRTTDGKLYAQPVKIAEVIETLEKGTQVLVLHQKGEWYAVSLTDQRLGWAHQSIFTAEVDTAGIEAASEAQPPEASKPAQTGRNAFLKVDSGRVRSAPAMDAEVEFGLAQYDPFKVLAKEGDWYHIQTESGRTGWIYHTLVQFPSSSPLLETHEDSIPPAPEKDVPEADSIPPQTTKKPAPGEKHFTVVLKVESGRVRTGPSKASATAFIITQGTRAKVTGTRAGWYHILLPDGRTGWSYMKLYDIVQEKGASTSKARKLTNAGVQASGGAREIRTIRFESTPDGDETIIFELNSFNPPNTFTVEDGHVPMVVCEFAETRLAPEIGSVIPVDGKLVTALSIRKPNGLHSPVRVEASLDPRFKYSVEQVFFKKANVYVMNFKK